jgi:uncharacterized membrane protein YcaP (DUF421 family)
MMPTALPPLWTPVLDVAILVAWVVLATRLAGLRSFSKMSAFDFVLTVATGSALASVVTAPDTGWPLGLVAVAAIFAVQVAISQARLRLPGAERLIDNAPLLLMARGEIDRAALAQARLTEADLMNKLRLAGVSRLEEVQAVVFETTGDVSVLTGEAEIAPELLASVRGRLRERVAAP